MKKYSLLSLSVIISLIFFYSLPQVLLAKNSMLVPEPREISFGKGRFPINPINTGLQNRSNNSALFSLEFEQITDEYKKLTGKIPSSNRQNPLNISLALSAEDAKIGTEGYYLTVEPKNIEIIAANPIGIFYGVQTLKQLLRANVDKGYIPVLTIADWPALSFRGVMDDISRGPVPTRRFMRHQIQRLSELKFNHLTYYSEHVIRTKSHPEFAPPDGSISLLEWEELSNYAKKYNIQLVGNFQSFGHFEKLLANPSLRPLGEADRMISPVLPESRKFLSAVLDEIIPVFDAPYFNINSDETFDLGQGYSKQAVEQKGQAVVYAEHVSWLHERLKKHDVRMMLWADIIAKHPEAIALIPQNTIMMPWGYDARQDFSGMIDPLKMAGYDIVIAPGILNSYRIMPNFEQTRHNLHNFIKAGVQQKVLGSWTTVWDDGGMALFAHDWYGLAYAAEQNWHPTQSIDKKDFEKRLLSGVYGTPNGTFTAALDQLARIGSLKPTAGFRERILWHNPLPKRGQTGRVDLSGWQDVLAIAKQTKAILRSAPLTYYPEDAEVFDFTASLFVTLAKTRLQAFAAAISYSLAVRNQRKNPLLSRQYLVDTIHSLGSVALAWRTIHERYEALWLRENRSYALDHVLDNYQIHIRSWEDAHKRTKQALRDFDMGQMLPVPSNVRLKIEPLKGQYFMGWLELGSFPLTANTNGLDEGFLDDAGGEAAARPKVTETIVVKGRKYRWHRILANAADIVDLAALNPDAPDRTILYEFAELTSPDMRLAKATIGSTGSIEIFLNGDRVYRHEGARTMIVDDDSVKLSLKPGKNYIMMKIMRHDRDFKFSFNLPESKISSHKNRYTILD